MKDFKIDSTGDLVINSTNRDLDMTTDSKALLAQQIQSLLNTNINELKWNNDYGLNHFELLFQGKNVNGIRQIIDNYLHDNLDGYASLTIDSSNYDSATRTLELIVTITMQDGTQVSAQIGGEN